MLFLTSTLYFQLMLEARLLTDCSTYEKAWEQLLPQLWEYAKVTNPDCINFDGSPEELKEMDNGNVFFPENVFIFSCN